VRLCRERGKRRGGGGGGGGGATLLTVSTWRRPRFALQSFFSVFTQISPVAEMFGWKIFVVKNPAGQTNRRMSSV
jgi:hypothetical protein